MKIGLFGQFGSGNTGNDGSLEAMLHVLNRISPNAQLVCICSDPEIITPKFQIRAVPVGQAASAHIYLRLQARALRLFPLGQVRSRIRSVACSSAGPLCLPPIVPIGTRCPMISCARWVSAGAAMA